MHILSLALTKWFLLTALVLLLTVRFLHASYLTDAKQLLMSTWTDVFGCTCPSLACTHYFTIRFLATKDVDTWTSQPDVVLEHWTLLCWWYTPRVCTQAAEASLAFSLKNIDKIQQRCYIDDEVGLRPGSVTSTWFQVRYLMVDATKKEAVLVQKDKLWPGLKSWWWSMDKTSGRAKTPSSLQTRSSPELQSPNRSAHSVPAGN